MNDPQELEREREALKKLWEQAPDVPPIRFEDTSAMDNPPYCDVCGANLESGSCSPWKHGTKRVS